jgi:hypothetical protein
MGLYNTPHPVKAFTRKRNGIHRRTATLSPPVRTLRTRRKGVYHTVRRNTVVPVNNNSRRVKPTALSENETRNLKKAKKRAKEWPDIVAVINDLDLLELTGVYLDENGKIVSIEGEITDAEYKQLIEELRNELNPKNSGYEQKIIKKAIKFVKKLKSRPKNY